jgi:hypothetical protein
VAPEGVFVIHPNGSWWQSTPGFTLPCDCYQGFMFVLVLFHIYPLLSFRPGFRVKPGVKIKPGVSV